MISLGKVCESCLYLTLLQRLAKRQRRRQALVVAGAARILCHKRNLRRADVCNSKLLTLNDLYNKV
jgi:hypothetical protein